MRILFICKSPETKHSGYWSSGLLNSAKFIVDMLIELGHHAKVVEVVDNNCIDREVTKYKPDHVVLEALWVVPEKFKTLIHLHPHVYWSIRIHSDMPFIANEGMALNWLLRYHGDAQVDISTNSAVMFHELIHFLKHDRVHYLPNYYPLPPFTPVTPKPKAWIDIGCFGAIRPLKNQLTQAVGAIIFANQIKKHLKFHINSSRIEMDGNNIVKNLRALFAHAQNAELVEHTWLEHDDFIKLIRSMDMGMAVSYTETFCITAADFAANNIPIIVSPVVDWVDQHYIADPNRSKDMAEKLLWAWSNMKTSKQSANYHGLLHYNHSSKLIWEKWLEDHPHHHHPYRRRGDSY